MPNRILRDWTDSETIDQLDVNTERFFTRLIMKVDDFGRYSANPKLLKSSLFPLKSDIRETDIFRWLTECEKSGLIVLYNVALKGYLQVNNFKQTLRQKTERYPPPDTCLADATQLHSNSILKGKETEKKQKRKVPPADLSNSNLFRKPKIPTIDEVKRVFKSNGGTDEQAQKFFDSNEGVGWFYKGSPITNFANFVSPFISNWNKYESKNSSNSGTPAVKKMVH